MVGLTPTVGLATIWPKPVASTGLAALQLGLPIWEFRLHSGMLIMLRLPGCVPSPWFSTTSSEVTGERSAHMGFGAAVPPVYAMGGRVMVGYATVDMLMSCAFNIQELQIAGGPDWVGKDRYDVEALPPDLAPSRKLTGFIANPTDEQQKMLLSLLVDSFGLKFHR